MKDVSTGIVSSGKSALTKWALAVFLGTLAWMVFLTQGLPIGEHDDWDHFVMTREAPFKTLLGNCLKPWSASMSWQGYCDVSDQVYHRRVLPSVLFRCVNKVFGYHFSAYFFFLKDIFFAGVALMLFLLLFQLTQSRLLSLAGTVFYLTLPVHYMHLMWMSDTIVLVHFFVLFAVWCYLGLVRNMEESGPWPKFLGGLILFWLAGVLAIKSKSPAAILVMLLGTYTVLSVPRLFQHKLKLLMLFLALGALCLVIIPVEHLRDATQMPTVYRWENSCRMVFRNYGTEYEDEPVSAFLNWDSIIPVSIPRNLGFLPLWITVALMIVYGAGRAFRSVAKENRFLAHPLAVIALIWFALEIALMGYFDAEPRYFSGTFLPITLLLMRLLYCDLRMWKGLWRWGLVAIGLAALIWSFVFNLNHIFFLRTRKGAYYEQRVGAARVIYQDQFPDDNRGWDPIGKFQCLKCVEPGYAGPRIEKYLYYSVLPPLDWNKDSSGDVGRFAEFAQKGAVYYLTNDPVLFQGNPNVTLLSSVDGCTRDSLFYHLYLKAKRKKPPPLLVYKWVGAAVP
ncbi:MAG: hypothetical protein PHS88_03910 [Candidatus Omnitrophica bacterium]|nr:hypothetical protein [Candidatus Omnitrophota bacterium]